MLGSLFNKFKLSKGIEINGARNYINNKHTERIIGRIIEDRNELTHRLLHSINKPEEIEIKANELILRIYHNFWDIKNIVEPTRF